MPLSDTDLDYVRGLVLDQSAIVLERSKAYLVESRLTPLATKLGFASLPDLVGKLRREPVNGTHRMVVDAMTTNETYFFRDVHPIDALRTRVFPDMINARNTTRTLRVWCGACSTGQEPYSMAMLLKEHFPSLATWQVSLLCTDLSRDVLAKAKSATYTQLEVNRGLPAAMLVKHFTKQGEQWQVKDDLRARLQFQELNLAKPFPPMPRFDLVMLRNVLIYFDVETKRGILARIRRVMAPDGILFLGAAETTLNIDDNFESVAVGKTVCYRLRPARVERSRPPAPGRLLKCRPRAADAHPAPRRNPNFSWTKFCKSSSRKARRTWTRSSATWSRWR
jgi:chemotaxis protein methyltransferase CheR